MGVAPENFDFLGGPPKLDMLTFVVNTFLANLHLVDIISISLLLRFYVRNSSVQDLARVAWMKIGALIYGVNSGIDRGAPNGS